MQPRGLSYCCLKMTLGRSASVAAAFAVCLGLGADVHSQEVGPDEAGLAQIRRDAEQGDADAEFRLGLLYALGTGTEKDTAEAVRWLRRASKEGHALANALLGASVRLTEASTRAPFLAHALRVALEFRATSWVDVHSDGERVVSELRVQGELLTIAADEEIRLRLSNADAVTIEVNGEPFEDEARDDEEIVITAAEAGVYEPVDVLRRGAARTEANLKEVLRRSAEQGHPTAQALLGRIGLLRGAAGAEKWIRRAVDQGDAWGSYYLGLMYYRGQGVTEDTAEAIRLWRQAADQGLSQGAAEIGNVYFLGIDVEEDEDEAARWYRHAVQLDHPDSNVNGNDEVESACGPDEGPLPGLSMDELGQRIDQADTAELREAAERGDADAQFLLAGRIGDDSPEDIAEAVPWLRRAADQGHALAQTLLGALYDSGEGVAEDDAEAVRWFRCAERRIRVGAERGDPDALYLLGQMYDEGEAVLKSYVEAERWYRQAAGRGSLLAQATLGAMYEWGFPTGGISRNWPEAERWYLLAADQGHASSQSSLGKMYAFGFWGVEKDYIEAARWYRLAAEQGDGSAQRSLDSIELWSCFKWVFRLLCGHGAAREAADRP